MPTEFFPHLHVGDVQKFDSEALISNGLIFENAASSSVYTDLLNAKTSGATIAEIKTLATNLLASNNSIFDSISEFETAFPQYRKLIDKLNSETIDLTTFNNLSAHSATNIDLVWESLMIQYIVNSSLDLLDLLQQTIKILEIKAKVDNGSITTIEEVLASWNSLFIILPSPLFPLPFNDYEPPVGNDPEPVKPDPAFDQIARLNDARLELTHLFSIQNEALKTAKLSVEDFTEKLLKGTNEDFERPENSDVEYRPKKLYQEYVDAKPPEFLNEASIKQLSDTTHAVIRSLRLDVNTSTVPAIVSRIDKEVTSLMQRADYKPRKEYVTNFGSVLMSIDHSVLQQIICLDEERIDHCKLIHQLNRNNPDTSLIQVLGMGYVNTIDQSLARYETGEIAHIENILQGESKNKSHRNLKRTEDFVETFSSTTHESETDQRTSERFELDKETSKITSSQTDLSAGVSVTAGYGPVSVTAGLDYASTTASAETASQAVNMAKEVTNRAINRIKETVEERRSKLSINEIEIINQHGINNEDGTGHITGFYYWVNKVYTNQVLNKGKRLMLEFMVPEPAAFHIYSKSNSVAESVNVEKPIAPNEYTDNRLIHPLKSFTDITRDNYHFWAAVYDVQEIPVPPSEYETVSSAYALDLLPEAKLWHDLSFNNLKVPAGYKANYGKLNLGFSSGNGRYIAGYLGNSRFSRSSGTMTPLVLSLDGERDIVPLSFRGHFQEYHMNVEIFCSITPEREATWQQEAYQAIINGYRQKLSDYENGIALLDINSGIAIEGDNPMKNRETEKTELKKWGIEMLTLQRFGQFNAMKYANNGHPEINFQEAYDEGKFVKFFEQSIEWNNMTYVFYPYFWGRKPRWTVTREFDDADPMFTKFLQAGYARVVVPVHPKFTEAILHYLSSGEIWQGQELPGLDNDLYLSIVEEIQAAQDPNYNADLGDSWEVTVPTNLVMLSDVIPNDLPGS